MGQDPEEALAESYDKDDEDQGICEDCGELPCVCEFDEGGESGC